MKSYTYGLFTLCITGTLSCSPQMKDRAIKEHIAVKAKEDINFAGVNYTVEKGTVSLSGYAPTLQARQQVESDVKGIAGVKDIKSSLAIGPVVIDQDFPLKQSIDSVLMKYNKVQAQVENGRVVLLGQASQEETNKLMKVIQQLPISSIDNQLVID
ncbi:MAG TPA: BON domain-containing protein [Flavisolibacter sp.]|nr:BON domain-containing protein [Flavisolibacter sp.]